MLQQQHERSFMSLWVSERQSKRFHGDSAEARHSPGQLSLDLSLAQAVVALHLQEALVQDTLADHVHALTHLQEIWRTCTHTHTHTQHRSISTSSRSRTFSPWSCSSLPENQFRTQTGPVKAKLHLTAALNLKVFTIQTTQHHGNRLEATTTWQWLKKHQTVITAGLSLWTSSVLKVWLESHEADHFSKD